MDRKEQIEKELKRTRRFLPVIKRILLKNVEHFVDFREATVDEDMQAGFDFLLQAESSEIAIRIRKPDCSFRDFTIRAKTPWNSKTEIHKIKEGKGDIYFYAWTEFIEKRERITEYWLIDLDKFRKGIAVNQERFTDNGDGTGFYYYNLEELRRDGAIILVNNLKRLYAA